MSLALDLVCLFAIGFFAAVGYRRGMVEELSRLIALVAAVAAAVYFHDDLASLILRSISAGPRLARFAAAAAIFLAVLLGLRFLFARMMTSLFGKRPSSGNAIAGLAFGAAKGIITAMILLWGVELWKSGEDLKAVAGRSYAYRILVPPRDRALKLFRLTDRISRAGETIRRAAERPAPAAP